MNIFTKALNVVGLQSTEGTKVRIQQLEKDVEEGQALATSQFANITSLREELFQVKTANKAEVEQLKSVIDTNAIFIQQQAQLITELRANIEQLKLTNEGHIAARTRMEFKINEAKMTLQRTLDEESL